MARGAPPNKNIPFSCSRKKTRYTTQTGYAAGADVPRRGHFGGRSGHEE
jgi:hypothetical protein